jgi:hypothetical protein
MMESEHHPSDSETQRSMELEQLIREMAAHFRMKDKTDQQAHYRSWRHAFKAHVNRFGSYYYPE